MNFDRNTVIGVLVLALLFAGYFWYTTKEQAAFKRQRAIEQMKEDSIKKVNAIKYDSGAIRKDSIHNNAGAVASGGNQFQNRGADTEKIVTLSNDEIRVSFSSKGGRIKEVQLLHYRGIDSLPVKLAGTDFDKIDYSVNTATGADYISSFNFKDSLVRSDISQTVIFSLGPDSAGNGIQHIFTLLKNDFMIDFKIVMNGADKLLSQGKLNLLWQYRATQQESDLSFEKQNTQIGYIENGDFDYHTATRRSDKKFDKPVQWLGIRQRFFNAFLSAKNSFSSGEITWTVPSDTTKVVVQSTANLQMQLPVQRRDTVALAILYGPADFKMLKQHDLRFEKLINLGQGAYAFVRPLNRYIVMPVFEFIRSISGSSLGLAIALLTIIIRLVISPLTYSSYLSGAKMKVLRPEIAKLREKYGNDQQQISVEQMKLFREAGVNPLGGCIPALLQIPIFFALYSFFSSTITLRGQSFLWAPDLSASDAVIKFGFNLPLIGSHLSLFTITAVVTSFLISVYSMSMSPDQSNPAMKYMPYIFPFFLLFIFNRLPSALTWYYTVSNVITLGLQFVIQNYIINHDKILAKIEQNRKKPKAKSKWQERMEQMQEQQKKLKEMQQKSKR